MKIESVPYDPLELRAWLVESSTGAVARKRTAGSQPRAADYTNARQRTVQKTHRSLRGAAAEIHLSQKQCAQEGTKMPKKPSERCTVQPQ